MTASPYTRATTLEEMDEKLEGFTTLDIYEDGLSYQPEASDIFISPYAKCGTTWMQQIVHGLRSNGSMAFDEITEAVPWIEMALDMGVESPEDQAFHPRVFKSHLPYDLIPKGGKYIIVFRDPVDACLSLFRFFEGWVFDAGCISANDFADYYLTRESELNYWHHTASWWAARDQAPVLTLCYEQLKQDLRAGVDMVADFMAQDYSEATRALATRQASYAFMKAHGEQFDDHLVQQSRNAACKLPDGGATLKVASGVAGAGRETLSADMIARFEVKWQETLGQQFGLSSYQALLAQVSGS